MNSEKEIDKWESEQRRLYKNKKLSPRKVRRIERIPGWQWRDPKEIEAEERSNRWFSKLKEFKDKNNHCYVTYIPHSEVKSDLDREHNCLADWCGLQQSAYKAGKLKQDEIDRLLSIGFHFNRDKNRAYALAVERKSLSIAYPQLLPYYSASNKKTADEIDVSAFIENQSWRFPATKYDWHCPECKAVFSSSITNKLIKDIVSEAKNKCSKCNNILQYEEFVKSLHPEKNKHLDLSKLSATSIQEVVIRFDCGHELRKTIHSAIKKGIYKCEIKECVKIREQKAEIEKRLQEKYSKSYILKKFSITEEDLHDLKIYCWSPQYYFNKHKEKIALFLKK